MGRASSLVNRIFEKTEDLDFPEPPTPSVPAAPTPSPGTPGSIVAQVQARAADYDPSTDRPPASDDPQRNINRIKNQIMLRVPETSDIIDDPVARLMAKLLSRTTPLEDPMAGPQGRSPRPSGPPGGDRAVPRDDSPGPGEGNCPPGEVYRTDSAGALGTGKPGCEPEDWRSKNDKDTCLDAPPDCGDGYEPWCDFTTAKWQCGYTGGGGGGGGNAGGGKGGASTAKPGGGSSFSGSGGPGGVGSDFDAYLQQFIRQALESPSRYTPQALQALYGEITRHASGQITRGQRDVRAQAARRGMSRSGNTAAALREVREGAERQRGQSVVGVQTAKINADYQDKMGAIDRAQRYLDSLRDSEYRWALMSEQRKQFDANLALAYANLAQQRSSLMAQLQSQWDMLRAQQGFATTILGVF